MRSGCGLDLTEQHWAVRLAFTAGLILTSLSVARAHGFAVDIRGIAEREQAGELVVNQIELSRADRANRLPNT